MRRLSVIVTLLVSIVPSLAEGILQSSFFSSPYYPAGRELFCERWHDVHWDSVNRWMVGINGAGCISIPPSSFSCCAQCRIGPGPPECSNANVGGHLTITTARVEYASTGLDRWVLVDAGIPGTTHLAGADHITAFSVVHPNCHVGVQGVVWGATPAGQYRLQIVISDDALGNPPYPNCGPFSNESPYSNPFPLQLGNTPRYELMLHSFLPFAPPILFADAELTITDKATQTTIQSIQFPGYYTAPYTYYSGEAKRFGFGGVRAGIPLTFDNFVGVAQ